MQKLNFTTCNTDNRVLLRLDSAISLSARQILPGINLSQPAESVLQVYFIVTGEMSHKDDKVLAMKSGANSCKTVLSLYF